MKLAISPGEISSRFIQDLAWLIVYFCQPRRDLGDLLRDLFAIFTVLERDRARMGCDYRRLASRSANAQAFRYPVS